MTVEELMVLFPTARKIVAEALRKLAEDGIISLDGNRIGYNC